MTEARCLVLNSCESALWGLQVSRLSVRQYMVARTCFVNNVVFVSWHLPECAPYSHLRVYTQPSAAQLDDLPHQGQAKS